MIDLTTLRVGATVVCFGLFIGIVVWAYARRNAKGFQEAAQLPFEQD
ncbi:cytochrome c oxidase cbb3-type subunit 4 [Variovorax sp. OK605]|nr:cbb3-type cytochrome c oxidase subunit 3 [Variovorax sp. OK605]SFQ59680.1 cytochrome c oxidase cbb3-type subunit 4 [Variovorax sp. OK605]